MKRYVSVFENANRAAVGQPPQFEAKAFHVYYDGDESYSYPSEILSLVESAD